MIEEKVIKLLNEGYSISEIKDELNVNTRKLYHIAEKHNLPCNAPIKSGGPKEKRIQRLYNSGFTFEDIGKIFSQSPKKIKRLIDKIK